MALTIPLALLSRLVYVTSEYLKIIIELVQIRFIWKAAIANTNH